MASAREAALKGLRAVHQDGAYANVAMAQILRREKLSDADRRLATELVYGVIKAGDTIDWMVSRYVTRPLATIAPVILEILRLGVYQLFFLDRIPPSAACNEAVNLAKKHGHKGTAGFVNAVLRTAVREPERAKFPEGKGREIERLALVSQHPEWLVRQWVKTFGWAEAQALCAFNNEPAVLSLRTNTLKIQRDELLEKLRAVGVAAEPSSWTPEGILCRGHGALDDMEALREGLFQVQDESSMQVAHVVAPLPGEFVIDACSAPGGKTTHLAALMKNQGRIIAADIYPAKLARVEENAARLGVKVIETLCCDAREIGDRYAGQADRLLLDVPCSGFGVLRRRADARWRKTPQEIAALPALQRAILAGAAPAIKTGGILVYSTCTIQAAENEEVVTSFLAQHPEFSLETTGDFLPLQKRSETMVQFYPQREKIDGFFMARLRKTG